MGEMGYYAVAKPYEYNIAANLFERYIDWAYSNDPGARKALDDYGVAFKSSFSVDPINPMLRTLVELYANRNYWGGQIENMSDQNKAKSMRFGPHTSQMAIYTGKFYSEMTSDPNKGPSPKQVDYFLKQTFGQYGNLGLSLLDRAMGVHKPVEGAEYAPLIGSVLYGQAEGTSRVTDQFYTNYNKALTMSSSINQMMKDGDTSKPKWGTKENVLLVQYLPVMRKYASEMSDIRKEYDEAIKIAPTAAARRKFTLQKDFIEKLISGLLYGVPPEPPHPDAGITTEQVDHLKHELIRKGQEALQNEIKRAGGATSQANYLLDILKGSKNELK